MDKVDFDNIADGQDAESKVINKESALLKEYLNHQQQEHTFYTNQHKYRLKVISLYLIYLIGVGFIGSLCWHILAPASKHWLNEKQLATLKGGFISLTIKFAIDHLKNFSK